VVGYNFKSELTFYNTPGNQNGKLSLKVYRDSILEPVVKPWLKRTRDPFIRLRNKQASQASGLCLTCLLPASL
jgi:hypothetical protein